MHTLLLADDSATIQRVIELTFAGENVRVVVAADGEAAIALITADRPDIVLADIGMSRTSGYEVAAYVKNDPDLAHIPVLLLAGAFEPVDQARAEQVRCDGVIVKPFEPQHVVNRVRELMAGVAGSPRHAVQGIPRAVERLTNLKLVEPPRREPEPAAARSAGPAEPAAPAGDPLDEYFDRLDAAFADIDSRERTSVRAVDDRDLDALDSELDVPTLDRVLADDDLPAARGPIDLSMFSLPPLRASGGAPPPRPAPVEPADSSPTLSAGPPQPSPFPQAVPPPAVRVVGPGADSTVAEGSPLPRSVEPSPLADAFASLLEAERGGSGGAAAGSPYAPFASAITDAMVDELSRRVLERLSSVALRDAVAAVVGDVAERLVRDEIARIRARAGE